MPAVNGADELFAAAPATAWFWVVPANWVLSAEALAPTNPTRPSATISNPEPMRALLGEYFVVLITPPTSVLPLSGLDNLNVTRGHSGCNRNTVLSANGVAPDRGAYPSGSYASMTQPPTQTSAPLAVAHSRRLLCPRLIGFLIDRRRESANVLETVANLRALTPRRLWSQADAFNGTDVMPWVGLAAASHGFSFVSPSPPSAWPIARWRRPYPRRGSRGCPAGARGNARRAAPGLPGTALAYELTEATPRRTRETRRSCLARRRRRATACRAGRSR